MRVSQPCCSFMTFPLHLKATNPLKQLPFRRRGWRLCVRIPNETLSLWNIWKAHRAKKWNTTIIWHGAWIKLSPDWSCSVFLFMSELQSGWSLKLMKGIICNLSRYGERKTHKCNSWLVLCQCLLPAAALRTGLHSLCPFPACFHPVEEPCTQTSLQ